jgi:hypothetical protein
MKTSIIKPIIGGVLLGTIVFFTGPFIIGLFAILLFAGFLRFGRRQHYAFYQKSPIAFAEKIRGMNDEEFADLKTKMQYRFSKGCHYQKDQPENI